MIIGIGTDIVEISRIEQTLERFGEQFMNKIFAEHERDYCLSRSRPAEGFAVRFAAKEAFAKAIGTGWTDMFSWRDISVGRATGEQDGRPYLILNGTLAERWNHARFHVSLSHTHRYATATVIIESD